MKKILWFGIIFLILCLGARLYMLALFPIFLIILNSEKIQKLGKFAPGRRLVKIMLFGAGTGVITEVLAIANNWSLPPEQKALFHPDPVINIVIGLGYYLTLVIAWHFLFRRYRYATKEVFIIGGIMGGLISEQGGAVIASGNLFMMVYSFFVHGSIIAIPFVLAARYYTPTRESKFLKYILSVLPYLAAGIGTVLWKTILGF